MDTKGEVGAILHVMPDDDPIAGEPSDMYFDRQGVVGDASAEVKLTVRNSRDVITAVAVKTTDSLSTATYTFPEQGVYTLKFVISNEAGKYVFEQSQRVTRGVVSSSFDAPQYYWAEVLLVTGAIGVFALGIVAFNRRKEIAKQSSF